MFFFENRAIKNYINDYKTKGKKIKIEVHEDASPVFVKSHTDVSHSTKGARARGRKPSVSPSSAGRPRPLPSSCCGGCLCFFGHYEINTEHRR